MGVILCVLALVEVQQMDVVVEGSVGVVKIGRNEHDNGKMRETRGHSHV